MTMIRRFISRLLKPWLGPRVLIFSALAASLLTPGPARAHPHVWVTVQTTVLFDNAGAITGFRHEWVFDEYYTAFALQGMDKNGDGEYSDAELEPLAKTNVESLSEFDYFTFAELGDDPVPRSDPVDYRLVYSDDLLTLRFTLPLAEPVPAEDAGRFSFKVYDPTYFVAFSLSDNEPIKLAGTAPGGCETTIADAPMAKAETQSLSEAFFENLDASGDWGAQFAREIALRCKPGS
ncbi:MAG: DUF1007 family protein [Dichotomicrobium sp.]